MTESDNAGFVIVATEYHRRCMELADEHGHGNHSQGGPYGNTLQALSCGRHEKMAEMLFDRGQGPKFL